MFLSILLVTWLTCQMRVSSFSTDDDVDSGGLFTSNADLQDLLWTEVELVRSMKDYIKKEEQKLDKLRQSVHVSITDQLLVRTITVVPPSSHTHNTRTHRYVAEYEQFGSRAADDQERFVGNPLNSFLLIKKMTSDWKEVKELIKQSPAEDFLANLTSRQQRSLKWPSEEDLSGAAVALVRLQVRQDDCHQCSVADHSSFRACLCRTPTSWTLTTWPTATSTGWTTDLACQPTTASSSAGSRTTAAITTMQTSGWHRHSDAGLKRTSRRWSGPTSWSTWPSQLTSR